MDYLSELAISSEDDPPHPPSVDNEHKHILQHQLELFGLLSDAPMLEMPDSDIIKDAGPVAQLQEWLREDGSDGEFNLLYRSSRDGLSGDAFHSKCDNKCSTTLTVIETTDGFVLGGYSNIPWASDDSYHAANKAFLFVLSGRGISSPCKMKLKNAGDANAVCHGASHGPIFGRGHDLWVNLSKSIVNWRLGHTYQSGPSQLDNNGSTKVMQIKEMEVFQFNGNPSRATVVAAAKAKDKHIKPQIEKIDPTTIGDVNEAIDAKQAALLRAESEILHLEVSLEDERNFIFDFVRGHTKDVVLLNVSGTTMATKRLTLQVAVDSVLAQQFDDSKWTEQGCNALRVKEWTPNAVASWVRKIDGIANDVADIFMENAITGRELFALKKDGLKMMGITRTGTICVLLEEIKLLEKGTLVEHSAYCFGKILDYLRLKQLQSRGLAVEPALPAVVDSQRVGSRRW